MLTADNITEWHIDLLRDALVAEGAAAEDIGATYVAQHELPTPISAVRAARARCAEILNAREPFEPPTASECRDLLARYLKAREALK